MSGPQNDRSFLPGSDPSSPVIWRRDVGGDPSGWISPGELPSQGNEKADGDTTSDMYGWDLGLPPARRGPAGGRFGFSGDLYLQTL